MNTLPRDLTLWKGQLTHITCLLGLLVFVWSGWGLVEKPFPALFWVAIIVPVVHQVFVWFTWRLELKYATISRTIGFQMYLVLFFVLFLARFISLALLAWVDRGSLGLAIELRGVITLAVLLPGLYAMYSVKKYFGLARAAGADHFDTKYKTMPFIKKGIFRFTSNGMYLYAFLLFWAVAMGFNSIAALIVAFFSHAYIWVHYFCTEQPDMEFIYG